MLVVIIIGVLAALALPRFSAAAKKAKYAQARLYLKYFYQSLTIFYTETGCYPADAFPNIPPAGIIPQYADEWPGPDRDPMNSVYRYAQWPAPGGGNWIGVIYLGPNIIHDSSEGSGSFYANHGNSGDIREYGDDIYIVIEHSGAVCN